MDSCWVALQNLEEITKKFQRCTLEKLSMDQLFWECESNMITRRVDFQRIKMFPYIGKKINLLKVWKISSVRLRKNKKTTQGSDNNSNKQWLNFSENQVYLLKGLSIKNLVKLYLLKKNIQKIMIVYLQPKQAITRMQLKQFLTWPKIWRIMNHDFKSWQKKLFHSKNWPKLRINTIFFMRTNFIIHIHVVKIFLMS